MKRLILFVVWTTAFIGSQFFVNCSNPLEGIDQNQPAPPGPGLDTIFSYDTVTVVDTMAQTDTVTIVEPGEGGPQVLCSRIASNQREIVWLFRNQEGSFNLEFAAAAESDRPPQTLLVDIDGHTFPWNPAKNPEFITTMTLEQNATIRISSTKPPSLGHAIHICLTLSQV